MKAGEPPAAKDGRLGTSGGGGERAWLGTGRDGEGRTRLDRLHPACQLGEFRTLDREVEAALDHGRQRDLGQREAIEREPLLARNMAVEDLELRGEIGTLRREVGRAFGGQLLRILEHGEVRRIQRRQHPVHPTLDLRLLGRRGAGELRRVGRREITQDRVRFPRRQIAVDQRRHLLVRVELAIGVGVRVVELPTVVFAHIFQANLFEEEEHLLDVAGGSAAKDTDHFETPGKSNDYCFSAFAPLRNLSLNAPSTSIAFGIAPWLRRIWVVFVQASLVIQPSPCAFVSALKNVPLMSASICLTSTSFLSAYSGFISTMMSAASFGLLTTSAKACECALTKRCTTSLFSEIIFSEVKRPEP